MRDRITLERCLTEAQRCGELENRLALAQDVVREQRAAADGEVAAIMRRREAGNWTPRTWRRLLAGIEPGVAAACTRHSRAGA